jgi:hypothetical protein
MIRLAMVARLVKLAHLLEDNLGSKKLAGLTVERRLPLRKRPGLVVFVLVHSHSV